MLAFDLLRVALARAVNLRLQMPRVDAPMICRILCNPKRLQQSLQLQKHLILASPKDIGKDGPREVIDRVPKPPVVYLSNADNGLRPLPIYLRCINQTVISSQIGFSGPHLALLAYMWARLTRSVSR